MKRGSPPTSDGIARVLTNRPISPSVSTRVRPATGVPTAKRSWPDQRSNSASKQASNVMNSVEPWLRPSSSSRDTVSRSSSTRSIPP